MKTILLKFLSLFLLVVLFHVLFWQNQLGLNLFLYSTLFIGLNLYFFRKTLSKTSFICAIGAVLTGAFTVINHTAFGITIHILASLTALGFIYLPHLKFNGYAALTALVQPVQGLLQIANNWLATPNDGYSAKQFFKRIRWFTFSIPLIFLLILLYAWGSSGFAKLLTSLGDFFDVLLFDWFQQISGIKVAFWWLGLILALLAIPFTPYQGLFTRDKNVSEVHDRKSHRIKMLQKHFKNNATKALYKRLKTERQRALTFLVSINIIMLFVNFTDIQTVWFVNSDALSARDLAKFVHEGTYALIASILISIGVLLYLFRGTQNFWKHPYFKPLSYLWIAQNTLLIVGVAIRNYHYIAQQGLAYKRLGVCCFLIATIVGIVSLVIKIKHKKTIHYLWRINGWSIYLILIFASLFNWERIIVQHNLTNITDGRIEQRFVRTRALQTTDLLYKYWLPTTKNKVGSMLGNHSDPKSYCDDKAKRLQEKLRNQSWLSWNWAEYRSLQRIKQQGWTKP